MTVRRSIALVLALGSLSWARVSAARPSFPEKLQDATGAPCPPQCNICHRDNGAGEGTLDKPFFKSLSSYGEVEEDMRAAVEAMKQAGVDSDGDGTPDIDEIAAGDDPNSSLDAKICFPDGGCGARVAPRGPLDPQATAAALLAVVALGWLARRRRG